LIGINIVFIACHFLSCLIQHSYQGFRSNITALQANLLIKFYDTSPLECLAWGPTLHAC